MRCSTCPSSWHLAGCKTSPTCPTTPPPPPPPPPSCLPSPPPPRQHDHDADLDDHHPLPLAHTLYSLAPAAKLSNKVLNCNNTIRESQKLLTPLSQWHIWRGVRSGVQLSCTDTRFQKCLQSGKSDSKHPMLTISIWLAMWFKAKNQPKHSKNQNCWLCYIIWASDLRNQQKSLHKKRITQSRFIQFFVFVWHILHAIWRILMSRRFRVCVGPINFDD